MAAERKCSSQGGTVVITGNSASRFVLKKSTMEVLNKPHIHVKDRKKVEGILCNMIKDGPSKLQIVADFDRTLSKFSEKGIQCATCFDVLEDGLSEEYRAEAKVLSQKYGPVESDPSMTIAEKIPLMVEWWSRAHELLMKFPPTKQHLHTMVENSRIKLRDGYDELFNSLHKYSIPLLIFSAGIGNIIREVISQKSTMFSNMHVVSNDLVFDDSGKMTGFDGSLIHMFNKNEHAVHDSDYFDNLRQHTSLLLLGDSLGDLQMASGAENVKEKLTIGFLNTRVEENLEKYMNGFDIIIVEDETLDVVNGIVSKILASNI